MKFIFSAAAAAVLFAGASFAADAKIFADLEQAWSDAFVKKDTAAISKFVADDWSGQSDDGKTQTKASLLERVKSGKYAAKSMKNHDTKVKFFGGAVVVQGLEDEVSTENGKDSSGTYSYTDVFVERGGKWVAVASQVTKVRK